jgi:hypothetical protein
MAVRGLLAAGMVAAAAAGCASQGVAPGALPTGASGSVPGSVASLLTSAPASASASTAASSQDPASPTDPSNPFTASLPDTTPSSAPGKVSKIGDVVTEGGFKLKIHSITLPYNPPAGSFFTPPPGKKWLMMDFEVTEVGDQPLMFSTLGGFDLTDSANNRYIDSVAGADSLQQGQKFQEHEMKPGETAHGEIIFEINQDAKGLKLTFKGNMWHASQTPPVIDLGR